MKQIRLRFIAILLSFFMVFNSIPTNVIFAEGNFEDTYNLSVERVDGENLKNSEDLTEENETDMDSPINELDSGLALKLGALKNVSPSAMRMVVGPKIIYVNGAAAGADNGTNWNDAYTKLQMAIDESVSGDQIWVARGTYLPTAYINPSNLRQLSFNMKDGVNIYGGFDGTENSLSVRNPEANATILSGDIGTIGVNTDNVYHVVYAKDINNALLDGFTITGGYGQGDSYGGGGIYINSCNPSFANLIIKENSAIKGGGIYSSGGKQTYTNVVVRQNTTTGTDSTGGGICLENASNTGLTDVLIEQNTSNSSGGGIYYSGTINMIGCNINQNNSKIYGGGIYGYASSKSVLTNVTINQNKASSGGGAYLDSYSSLNFSKSRITNNIATSGSGGGIYTSYGTLVSSESAIENNTALNNGGGIYAGSTTVTFDKVTINYNQSKTSGGIYSSSLRGSIDNSEIKGNKATSGDGGGMYLTGSGTSKVSNTKIQNNTASRYGGAIYTDGSTSQQFRNILIAGNQASDNAGALYNKDANPEFINTTMVNNSGGSIYNFSGKPKFTNCIIYNNGNSKIDYYTSGNIPIITYSDVEGGYTGAGNINLDPKFDSNFAPSTDSPCINAGSNTVTTGISIDLLGYSRIYDGTVDMGAIEFQGEATPQKKIIFIIKDSKNTAVPGATITIKSSNYVSDSAGRVDILGLDSGSYEYTVSKLRYADVNGSIAVVESDLITEITLNRESSIIYVKNVSKDNNDGTSWNTAYNDLQTALSEATYADQIWVAAGTYYPTSNNSRQISFNMKDGVNIYGGFAGTETDPNERDLQNNKTILSGNIGNLGVDTDNSYHVVYAKDITNALLDGFTITGGNANGDTFGGGGIYINNCNPNFANLIINLNKTTYAGGGIYSSGGGQNYENIVVSSNISNNNGGGIYLGNSKNSTLANIVLDSNSGSNGGGLFSIGNVKITDGSITKNKASNSGGGIYFNGTCTLENTIVGGDLKADGNISSSNGGGIYSDGTINIAGGAVKNNQAKSNGGGIYNSSTIKLADTIIESNSASSYGGGIYLNSSYITATNTKINFNNSANGGGIYYVNSYNSDSSINNCEINGNIASSNGGGVNLSGSSSYKFKMINTKIQNNEATQKGGGIYYDSSAQNHKFANLLITGNKAAIMGGIYNNLGSPEFINITMVNNEGGSIYSYAGIPKFTNSIIWNNGNSKIDYYTSGNIPIITYSGIEGGYVGQGNINLDPELNGSFELSSASPCVNVGLNSVATSISTTDLAGKPRIYEGIVDMGAIELQENATPKEKTVFIIKDGISNVISGVEIAINDSNYISDLAGRVEIVGLSKGDYSFKATKPRYIDYSGTLTIDDTNSETIITLQRDACIIYVNVGAIDEGDGTSWITAYNNLQTAIDEAVKGDQIWVAKGTYLPIYEISPTDLRTQSFNMKDEVNIYGGFLGEETELSARDIIGNTTILSGDIGAIGVDKDNVYHVVYAKDIKDALLDGFTITGGYAGGDVQSGGGIYVNNCNPKFANLIVTKNSSPALGGGIYASGGTQSYTNITVTENKALGTGGGGGIYLANSTNSILTDIAVNNNTTNGFGGGIYITGTAKLTNGTISYNKAAASYGGAAYGKGTIQMDNISVESNTSEIDGGGIAMSSSCTLTFINGKISNNTAKYDGGGLMIYGSLILKDSVVENNTARLGSGGGIYKTDSYNIVVESVKINGNLAYSSGGGIYLSGARGTILDTEVSNNKATTGSGGGIFNTSGSSTLTISNTKIQENYSKGNGGGIYNSAQNTINLKNLLITKNTSDGIAGGLYNQSGSPILTNVTVATNIGGSFYNYSGKPTFANCIIWNNWDTKLEHYVSFNTPIITYSNLDRSYEGKGNINTDPKFVNEISGDYHLQNTSPSINTGSNAAVSITTDLDGNTRNFDTTVDMGAYEHQVALPNDLEIINNDLSLLEIMYAAGDSASSVTKNVQLPIKGASGLTTVTWESDGSNVINTNGTVTRKANEDVDVTLTATITKGSTSQTINFILTVNKLTPTDMNQSDVNYDTENLTIQYAKGDSAQRVTNNIGLPVEGEKGSVISWESSNEDAVSTDGIITHSDDSDTIVTLTATITKGQAILVKTFDIVIKAKIDLDQSDVDYDAENLAIQYVEGDSAESVTKNIGLSVGGEKGSTIIWESSNEAVVSIDGTINRPDTSDTIVTLTATITKGEAKAVKNFDVVVKIKETIPVDMDQSDVNYDTENLAIQYAEGDSAESVTKNIGLPAEGDKGSTITWESSNEAVVSIDGTINRPDTSDTIVTITATITKGEVKSVNTFDLVVKRQIYPVIGITLDKSANILKQGESVQLLAEITPENATNKTVIWTSDNSNIASVSKDGKVQYVGDGVALITASTMDGGYTAVCTIFCISGDVLEINEKTELNGKNIIDYINELQDKSIDLVINIPNATIQGFGWNGNVIIKAKDVILDNFSIGRNVTIQADTVKIKSFSIGGNLTIDASNVKLEGGHVSGDINAYCSNLDIPLDYNIYGGVLNRERPEQIALAYDYDSLAIKFATGDRLDSIKQNIILSRNGDKGSTIDWYSSDNNTVTVDGKVFRPDTSDKVVTLTAVLKNGSFSKSKIFTITVKKKDVTAPPVTDTGNNNDNNTSSGDDSKDGENTDKIATYSENAGTIKPTVAVTTTSTDSGKTIAHVALENESISKATSASGNVSVNVPDSNEYEQIIVDISGQSAKDLQEHNSLLEIKTGLGNYTLNVADLNLNKAYQQLGALSNLVDVNIEISISKSSEQQVQVVRDISTQGGFAMMVPPIEFDIKCSYGDRTVEVNKFIAFVERTIPIPDNIDPNSITTCVVIEPDGRIRHVPTRIELIDGKYYAVVNSITNSTYVLIGNSKTFTDISDSYAKEIIEKLASRFVLSGYEDGTFRPRQSVTRAEFMAILMNSLGVQVDATENYFKDISSNDWYYSVINTAYENGLSSGYDNGTFAGNTPITRQEAMILVIKASKFAKLPSDIPQSEIQMLLSEFKDAGEVSDWADKYVALGIKNKFVLSYNNELNPLKEITREETVSLINNMLVSLKLEN